MTTAEMYAETAGMQRQLLARAEAQMEKRTPDDPFYVRAEALANELRESLAETERNVAEATTTAEAAGGVDALTRNMQQLDAMRRDFRERRNQYESQISADNRFTQEYRAQLMREWDEANAAEAEQAARAAWQTYQRAEQAVAADMQVAYRDNEARFDLPSVGVLVKDYAAQMQAPPVPQGMESDSTHRLRYIATLLQRAEASGDPNALRAARIAAAPEVRRMMGTSDSDGDRLARDLHSRLARMSETERGRVVELERKADALRQRGGNLRATILGLEQATTGKSGGIYGVSRWQAAVLGESMETFGGGVVTK